MTVSDSTAAAAAPKGFPWWLMLLQGIFGLVIGVFLLMYPAKTTIVLVQVIAWWWLIMGGLELISLFWDRTKWGWKLFGGALSVIAGAFIIGAPLVGALTLVAASLLILGIQGIIVGIAMMVQAFQGGGWGRGVLGLISLVFGLFIAFNWTELPMMAALVWVYGVFAIAGGTAAIISSFQVKKLQGA
jgi:uncharacterized membrane protein HdeD (DUF308 family)